MSGFDHDAAARADIANSPEISGAGAVAAPPRAEKPEGSPPVFEASPETDSRNARLLVANADALYKGIVGEGLNKDQAGAFEELAGALFGSIRTLGVSRGVYIGILAAIVALPFIPVALRFFPKKKVENND